MKSKSVRLLGGVFGYSAAVASMLGYGFYALYLLKGEADTNIVTWCLWGVEAVLSFYIYRDQTRGDLPKYLEEAVAAIGCCSIGLLLIVRAIFTRAELFGPVEWTDGVSIVLFFMVFRIYRSSLQKNDVWPATLAFQGLIVFSALPLARTAFENPSGEPLWPWVLWTIGFAFQSLCAYLRREDRDGHRVLLTPLNYLFWHALVAGIAYLGAA